MSGKKAFKEQADEGFLRAAYDLQADMRLGSGINTSIELVRTRRKGVYEIVATARPEEAYWKSAGVVVYRREWPRSEVSTLAAALFQAVHALDIMVGQEMMGEGWVQRVGIEEE